MTQAEVDRYPATYMCSRTDQGIDELPSRLQELPADTEVIAYCRGPYCVYADQAVRMLHRRGLRAARLEHGYPEWLRGCPWKHCRRRRPVDDFEDAAN